MFGWFKKNDQKQQDYLQEYMQPIGPCVPDESVQIVGDVHGCLELMNRLLTKLDSTKMVVMVGDYVDRGHSSREVLATLKARNDANPDRFVCLKGNHEVMMLEFIDDPTDRGRRWLEYGGLDTLLSYEVSVNPSNMSPEQLIDVRDRFQVAVGDAMIDWIRQLATSYQSGNLVVTHAGMDPNLPLGQQTDKALLWGRSGFLNSRRRDGLWVAFGHNVFSVPVVEDGRIATDTGAYHSGRLTAAIAQTNGEIEFVQVCDA